MFQLVQSVVMLVNDTSKAAELLTKKKQADAFTCSRTATTQDFKFPLPTTSRVHNSQGNQPLYNVYCKGVYTCP